MKLFNWTYSAWWLIFSYDREKSMMSSVTKNPHKDKCAVWLIDKETHVICLTVTQYNAPIIDEECLIAHHHFILEMMGTDKSSSGTNKIHKNMTSIARV